MSVRRLRNFGLVSFDFGLRKGASCTALWLDFWLVSARRWSMTKNSERQWTPRQQKWRVYKSMNAFRSESSQTLGSEWCSEPNRMMFFWPDQIEILNFFILHFSPVQDCHTRQNRNWCDCQFCPQGGWVLEKSLLVTLMHIFNWKTLAISRRGFCWGAEVDWWCSSAIAAACFCSSAKAIRGKSVPGEKPDSVIQKGLLFFLIPQVSNNCAL